MADGLLRAAQSQGLPSWPTLPNGNHFSFGPFPSGALQAPPGDTSGGTPRFSFGPLPSTAPQEPPGSTSGGPHHHAIANISPTALKAIMAASTKPSRFSGRPTQPNGGFPGFAYTPVPSTAVPSPLHTPLTSTFTSPSAAASEPAKPTLKVLSTALGTDNHVLNPATSKLAPGTLTATSAAVIPILSTSSPTLTTQNPPSTAGPTPATQNLSPSTASSAPITKPANDAPSTTPPAHIPATKTSSALSIAFESNIPAPAPKKQPSTAKKGKKKAPAKAKSTQEPGETTTQSEVGPQEVAPKKVTKKRKLGVGVPAQEEPGLQEEEDEVGGRGKRKRTATKRFDDFMPAAMAVKAQKGASGKNK